MFENKGIILKKLNPFNIFIAQLTLGMKVMKGLIVRIWNKLFRQHILTPMTKRLHHCIKLFIISGILLFRLIEFFIKVSNMVIIMTENTSNFYTKAS